MVKSEQSKIILVTGGAGFIGSHTCVELIQAGYSVIIYDNFSNSKKEVINRIEKITGVRPEVIEADLSDREQMNYAFSAHDIFCVIHFAGLKAVGESVEKPLLYFENNVAGTINLLRYMTNYQVKNLIFSSSATVYGQTNGLPIPETAPTTATHPYGRTKLMLEEICKDVSISDPTWNFVLLRYFNPVGAHESGMMGEDPQGIPNNLMPYIAQVAVGKRDVLSIYGNDYSTPDGTGIRDYIHVTDLAKGHLKALNKIAEKCGLKVYNLGTGKGISVMEMVTSFQRISGKNIPYQFVNRRLGDIDSCYANADLAKKELGWEAEKTVDDMCQSVWKWQSNNPHGYSI